MAKTTQPIHHLICLHLQGKLSDDEKTALDEWIATADNNRLLFEELTNAPTLFAAVGELYTVDIVAGRKKLRERMLGQQALVVRKPVSLWWRYAAVFAVCCITGGIIYYATRKQDVQEAVKNPRRAIKRC
jgi:hypothetical protein